MAITSLPQWRLALTNYVKLIVDEHDNPLFPNELMQLIASYAVPSFIDFMRTYRAWTIGTLNRVPTVRSPPLGWGGSHFGFTYRYRLSLPDYNDETGRVLAVSEFMDEVRPRVADAFANNPRACPPHVVEEIAHVIDWLQLLVSGDDDRVFIGSSPREPVGEPKRWMYWLFPSPPSAAASAASAAASVADDGAAFDASAYDSQPALFLQFSKQ